jgi:hypothetical protein
MNIYISFSLKRLFLVCNAYEQGISLELKEKEEMK